MTACDNYIWNGYTYHVSGTYIWNGINSLGCDSIATLYLTINNNTDTTFYKSSCYNYVWQGSTYNSSGVYYDTVSNHFGCDSILQLVLMIHNNVVTHNNVTRCNNYNWNGITYTQSGNYVWNGTTVFGCDSTLFLHLIINNSSSSSLSSTVCDSILWHGVTYTTSGVYTYTTQNTVGCDSIVTLNLIVNNGNKSIDTVSICHGESYSVENSIYTTTGVYIDTVNTTTNGCLTTIITHLTVEDSLIVNINQSTLYLYLSVIGGVPPYTYLWSTGSINYIITPTINATYWAIVTDNMLCIVDTVFFTVTNLSTDIFDNTISDVSIYPNPTNGLINIDFNVISSLNLEIRINNIIGERLFFNTLKSFEGVYSKRIDISDYSKGMYFLEIESENRMIKKKIILQ